jgi:hypothetical protein
MDERRMTAMPQFLLLLRDQGAPVFENLSPEEIQRVIEKYMQWGERLRAAGKMKGSEKLRDGEGRVLARSAKGAMNVTDGPYAETKEVVGGFYLVEAADYDEAARLCADSPHLDFGTIEIRAVEVLG